MGLCSKSAKFSFVPAFPLICCCCCWPDDTLPLTILLVPLAVLFTIVVDDCVALKILADPKSATKSASGVNLLLLFATIPLRLLVMPF